MRVFVTGATGFIGSAIVRELLAGGHSVLGLARSDASAGALAAAGAEVHRGDLTDVDSLAAGARACDGVVHTAFIHDFSKFQQNAETDLQAVRAMAAALEGTGKPLVIASGTALLAGGQLATEDQAAVPSPHGFRGASEEAIRQAAERGVRASVIRLPPTVHGAGDHGFVPMLVDIARKTGVAAYVGGGENRWPAVHRYDAARLFCLALETASPGARLHAVAEEGIPMRDIAGAIGEGLNVPVRGIEPGEAMEHFGWIGGFAQVDNPTSSAITRETMGWEPREIGLLDDIRTSGYTS